MERFVKMAAPTNGADFVLKLGILVMIGGGLNHLRDVITSVSGGHRPYWHNTIDASWTALPMCTFALLLIWHLNRLQLNLYQQATTDTLTNIHNRRYFRCKLTDPAHKDSVLVMLDVDNFKRFNDRFGHDIGDKCLVAIAEMLKAVVGDAGVCARYGGEEFAILISGRERSEIEDMCARFVGGVSIEVRPGYFERVTLSAGVSRCDESRDAVQFADAALYRAKDDGRACHVWTDMMAPNDELSEDIVLLPA